ncbi:hypothetical protein COW36_20920 [bacterium (Candidatus Blackallbacteria) CG17_big_fil_post_rev_8_21_14_2_50_48_46]|uniref:Uncharacterized protein n=1 Tax=bacterium (Candidatus Blackallbacteria) CG17_big_fil_post_rev_8_21_14_2_50_48_46 TaxID=2014261 RepID=A0A2M7FZ43_9BACT|nr:MAG: hypothetical protein COW64_14230 [bacterium (Candidatus Blackallbacteria) CG18_big_fil_WC_8_21_14_2_50_49_26]PIW14505.1 MAG: hypothetical protein COW36_20920 [bacterium (Candidatus Blackallbacteria) CG17_big_fil_post_rev_8_21_14_2_50_48_46]PIW47190.1 MAG: hypothetical protein COW20_13365 [bacterium (Candidatus Blackallbacteria) CG13_big_fil_rev_8_21_14_2_50_49_14]
MSDMRLNQAIPHTQINTLKPKQAEPSPALSPTQETQAPSSGYQKYAPPSPQEKPVLESQQVHSLIQNSRPSALNTARLQALSIPSLQSVQGTIQRSYEQVIKNPQNKEEAFTSLRESFKPQSLSFSDKLRSFFGMRAVLKDRKKAEQSVFGHELKNLLSVMAHPERASTRDLNTVRAFQYHCLKEFSKENVMGIDQMIKLSKMDPQDPNLEKKLLSFIQNCVNENGKYQINLPSNMRKGIMAIAKSLSTPQSPPLTQEERKEKLDTLMVKMVEVNKELYSLLKDPFLRFKQNLDHQTNQISENRFGKEWHTRLEMWSSGSFMPFAKATGKTILDGLTLGLLNCFKGWTADTKESNDLNEQLSEINKDIETMNLF